MPKGYSKQRVKETEFKKENYLKFLEKITSLDLKKGVVQVNNPVSMALREAGVSREALRLWRNSDTSFTEKEKRIRESFREKKSGVRRECPACGKSFKVDYPSSKKTYCSIKCGAVGRAVPQDITEEMVNDYLAGKGSYKEVAEKHGVHWQTLVRAMKRRGHVGQKKTSSGE